MTVLALACAKGSPGVTTTVLALAATWPGAGRVLVVEADPAGGDLAVRWGLSPIPGLLSLAAQHAITPETVWSHTQRLAAAGQPAGAGERGGLEVLLGPLLPEQGAVLGQVWELLGGILGRLGCDVLIDCGQLVVGGPTMPLLQAADRVLLVARSTPDGLAHLRGRLGALAGARLPLSVVLVGERPYPASEVAEALDVEVVGVLPDDPRGAGMLGGEPGSMRRLAVAPLVRAARGLADRLARPLTPTPTASVRP